MLVNELMQGGVKSTNVSILFVSLVAMLFVTSSGCDSQSQSPVVATANADAAQLNKDEPPLSAVTLKMKNQRIVFDGENDFKTKLESISKGAAVSILNERGGIQVMGDDDGFISMTEIEGMPDEYLNDPRNPIENKSKVDMLDPNLAAVLNLNKELQVGNKINRIEEDYVFMYTDGYYDEIARFKKSGIEISGNEPYDFSNNLKVAKLAKNDVKPSKGKIGVRGLEGVFFARRWCEYRYINDNLRALAYQWHTDVIFYKSVGVGAMYQEKRIARFLWWTWDVWVIVGAKTSVHAVGTRFDNSLATWDNYTYPGSEVAIDHQFFFALNFNIQNFGVGFGTEPPKANSINYGMTFKEFYSRHEFRSYTPFTIRINGWRL